MMQLQALLAILLIEIQVFPDSHKQRAEVDGVSLPLRSLYGKLGLKTPGMSSKKNNLLQGIFTVAPGEGNWTCHCFPWISICPVLK